ncbi:MAG TPA: EamA family transporter [Acidimicrobiia bacterium]|nr:EamA family transporter [Acidimicrobiia bacterium]
MSALLALLASLIYGAADFYGGVASRRMSTIAVVFWSQLVGLAFALAASLLFTATSLQTSDLIWGAVAGIVGTGGIYALYQGLARGRMSVVSPIAALLSALIPLGLGLGLGERPRPLEWVGVLLALPAIWLVSSGVSEDKESNGGLGYGILAGLGFGLYFVFLAQTTDGAGFWPLVASRTASVVVMAGMLWARRVTRPLAGTRLLVALVGIGDIAANVFLLLAFRAGLLTLVAVLASLYPAITVLLAVLILKEPVAWRQRIGLVLALAAVALIAV